MNSKPSPLFTTRSGMGMGGVSHADFRQMYAELQTRYGLKSAQICEAASYSMAMVVRFALGLSATAGEVAVLINDSLSGWIALATARHLFNAGANVHLLLMEPLGEVSADFELQCEPLGRMGLELIDWSRSYQDPAFTGFVSTCHNAICGLFGSAVDYTTLNAALNEISTPVHVIQAPLGLDVTTGQQVGVTLQASSTLSLGAPFTGLFHGADFAGRHYLCDISFPRELYEKFNLSIAPAFSDQPVVQIFPAGQSPPEDILSALDQVSEGGKDKP